MTNPMPRRLFRRIEPVVGMIFFCPEIIEAYEARGLKTYEGYFCSRSAAFGRSSTELVTSTFFNFFPDHVRRAVEGGWAKTSPDDLSEARFLAAGRALRRLLGDVDLAEATALMWTAIEHAPHQGRALYAAHLAEPRRDDPFEAFWQAGNLLREFRGDGHIAVLVAEGLGPVEALVLHAPDIPMSVDALAVRSRRWPEETVAATSSDLAARGLVDGDALTDAGRVLRDRIEERTDDLAAPAYDATDSERLLELLRPFSRAVVAGSDLPGRS